MDVTLYLDAAGVVVGGLAEPQVGCFLATLHAQVPYCFLLPNPHLAAT